MRKYILYIIFLIGIFILNLKIVNIHGGNYIIYRSGEIGKIIRLIPIWVDGRFTEGEKESIKEGIKEWDNGLNGLIKLKIVDEEFGGEDWKVRLMYTYGGWAIVKRDIKDLPIFYDNEKEKVLGYVDKIGGNILYLIEARLNHEMVKYVMMHEIGHLLGLQHEGKYLMGIYYSTENFQCIDERTMERIGKRWNIRKGLLNFCERM